MKFKIICKTFAVILISTFSSYANNEYSTEDYVLNKKVVTIQECIVADSTLCLMLDSAFSLFKVQSINRYNLPEAKMLYIQSTSNTLKSIVFKTINSYNAFESDDFRIHAMVLNYKGRQIFINPPEKNDSTIYHYLKPTKRNTDYTIYLFKHKSKEDEVFLMDKIIFQEVTFNLLIKKGRYNFGFKEYRYHLTDNSFIYDDFWLK